MQEVRSIGYADQCQRRQMRFARKFVSPEGEPFNPMPKRKALRLNVVSDHRRVPLPLPAVVFHTRLDPNRRADNGGRHYGWPVVPAELLRRYEAKRRLWPTAEAPGRGVRLELAGLRRSPSCGVPSDLWQTPLCAGLDEPYPQYGPKHFRLKLFYRKIFRRAKT